MFNYLGMMCEIKVLLDVSCCEVLRGDMMSEGIVGCEMGLREKRNGRRGGLK